jgi:hypothetical protein
METEDLEAIMDNRVVVVGDETPVESSSVEMAIHSENDGAS